MARPRAQRWAWHEVPSAERRDGRVARPRAQRWAWLRETRYSLLRKCNLADSFLPCFSLRALASRPVAIGDGDRGQAPFADCPELTLCKEWSWHFKRRTKELCSSQQTHYHRTLSQVCSNAWFCLPFHELADIQNDLTIINHIAIHDDVHPPFWDHLHLSGD